jgi:hypothetical protein
VVDRCEGYDEWIIAFNRELLGYIDWLAETPEPLRGSEDEMSTQLAESDRESKERIGQFIAWLRQTDAPPAAQDFVRLNIEAWEVLLKQHDVTALTEEWHRNIDEYPGW